MKKLKVKIITGYRKDQHYTVDAEEAHKAYYLFLNPDQRGIFKDGIAILGSDIRAIEPDYNASMGWNATHDIDEDDMNEIKGKGIDRLLRDLLYKAKMAAQMCDPRDMNMPLSDVKLLV